nr:MaoC/PaaZ C-terminal domain-containing protein [Klebsiella variicola]
MARRLAKTAFTRSVNTSKRSSRDSLLTPRRTLTEADIVNFACLSGDHFYAHMDKIAAAESIFGERVVHGYFLISAAAGLFVDARRAGYRQLRDGKPALY